MSRILMKPLLLEEGTYRCTHEKIWPPPQLHLIPRELPRDAEFLRFRVSEEIYQRVKTWQGVCGLLQMEDKCLTCPHVLQGDSLPVSRNQSLRPPSIKATKLARSQRALEKKP